jgi:hypothetical protein
MKSKCKMLTLEFAIAISATYRLLGGFVFQGGNSQNFLRKFLRFFLTLCLKILKLFRLKVPFETDIIKG